MPRPITWVEIDRDALLANLRTFRRRVGPRVALCPVVKANAYGHGLTEVARLVEPHVGFLAVQSLEEAVALRRAGARKPILILGYVPRAALHTAARAGFHLSVSNRESLLGLARAGRRLGSRVPVHLELETGTHRLGVVPEDLPAFAAALHEARDALTLAGVSTHFANIEDTTNHTFARSQLRAYRAGLERLATMGLRPRLRHTACSAAAILFDETHFDLVRVGISLYGHWPSRETLVSSRTRRVTHLRLRPVLTWKTRVAQLQDVPAGATVGYGCSHRTTRRSRLAVLPSGYWDGYDRGLSNIGRVLVRGQEAPVRGRVCMNMTMVDVTDVPGVALEDEVVLLGAQGPAQVSAEDLATLLGTIPYEVLTRINPTLPRVVV
ncbi:MAG: alanine racemase [Deltaproteobacteria bacterium]|nr:alanine racemase [Deltaproteobacteria bacterium]